MLVDINLLPRKRARNITTPLVYGICSLFVLFVLIILITFSHLVNQDVTKAEQELQTVQQLREAKEESIRRPQSSSSAQRLESTVAWAEEYPLEMVPIMKDLVRLLPSRGFVQSFTYAESGTLNVTVQFDESRDAAYYLYHLNESVIFDNVNLSSISTSNIDGDTEVDVLPRYVAEYSLTFNRAALQMEEEAAPESEEDAPTDTEEEPDSNGEQDDFEDGGEEL